LPVESDYIFDGPGVSGFVVVSGGIFDIVESEFVLASGCNGCTGISASPLKSLISVAVCVFFATIGNRADPA